MAMKSGALKGMVEEGPLFAKNRTPRIAYFISPHGYGHAARAAAVMEAIRELDPTVALDVFTSVPRWFFRDSLSGDFEYHDLLTDIGMVQRTPMEADLPETLRRLNRFLPFRQSRLTDLADRLRKKGCTLVVSDISLWAFLWPGRQVFHLSW